jgi:hypothetical protein
MIPRHATPLIKQLSEKFPAVLILGPRQCGKTTLARNFLKGEYFDLEKPSDAQVFGGDFELALRRFAGPLIIDEAQTFPGLFTVLRALIDEKKRESGRYYLLGSVNPSLIAHIPESLAGRMAMVELTPFLLAEARKMGVDLHEHWLRGGFPDACRQTKAARWERWQENYIRTLVERDLLRQGVRFSPVQMRRLLGMIAHHHGGILNASQLGRSLGVTYHTINSYLDILEGYFLLRRLPPLRINVGKRLVKSPKLYLRDTGVLHYLLGITSERQLLESPQRGNSWEGYLVEQITARESLLHEGSRFYYFRTHAGAEIDLVAERGQERTGFEFKCALSVSRNDWSNLRRALAEGLIHKGCVVYLGERTYPAAENIEVISADSLLENGG